MAAHPYPARSAVLPALLAALAGALRHWRLIVLGWLAGLLPAAFAAAPIRSLANQALGRDPDAARIAAGHDLEPVIEALLSLPDGGLGAGLSRFGLHASLALLIAALLAPWLAGMLVASLREGRALGFGELWSGGWREYGRQFRLLLVAISLGIIALAFVDFLFGGHNFWRSVLAYAMGGSIILLVLNRLVVGGVLGVAAFRRRVLVLGAGARA